MLDASSTTQSARLMYLQAPTRALLCALADSESRLHSKEVKGVGWAPTSMTSQDNDEEVESGVLHKRHSLFRIVARFFFLFFFFCFFPVLDFFLRIPFFFVRRAPAVRDRLRPYVIAAASATLD